MIEVTEDGFIPEKIISSNGSIASLNFHAFS